MTLHEMQGKLRRANRGNYVLYLFCNFMALLLITAFAGIMLSPAVLRVLPVGGDSRKQVYAIFVLACVGCVVFTIYAASLFFRHKSREMGILMALGASQKQLVKTLLRETVTLSSLYAALGALLGLPFAWGIWQLFRLFIVDSQEMVLSFDFRCYLISALFLLLVVSAAVTVGILHLRHTDILQVICEEHKNEPVKELGRWCGPLGIFLLLFGAVTGYASGGIYMDLCSAYPPAWLNILYAPVFVGLYMILLHTVIHGWRKRKKDPYKGLIARSMMKFQGKQTVNSMLVVTVLLAGGCFGMFYIPILGTGVITGIQSQPADYAYFYPGDLHMMDEGAVKELAAKYGVKLKDWQQTDYARLALGIDVEVEDEGRRFHHEYDTYGGSGIFLPESGYNDMTGEEAALSPGTYMTINNAEGTADLYASTDVRELSNMTTRETIPVTWAGELHTDRMTFGSDPFYVLNDGDYEKLTEVLEPRWRGTLTWFMTDGEDSYEFARAFYDRFIDAFAEKGDKPEFFDPVSRIMAEERGETFWGDEESEIAGLTYEDRQATNFKLYWSYKPMIRILDMKDTLRQYAVFLMVFLFVAIVCFLAALVICYTRSITIAMNNRYVFDDLKRLGAAPDFLRKEIRRQVSKVFQTPSAVGISAMYLLYGMILYGNDGRITSDEILGFAVCGLLVIVIGAVIYTVYRRTLRTLYRALL